MIRIGFASVAAMVTLTGFSAAPGKHVSDDYQLTVDGRTCEVVRVPTPEASAGCIKDRAAWQPYSYCSFVATAAVEVVVRSAELDLNAPLSCRGAMRRV